MSLHKQFSRGSISSSHRVITLTGATVLDADAIKTTVATAATAQAYSGAALNGADVGADHIARPTPSGHTEVAQYPIAVASDSAGSYVDGSLITFTGTYGGLPFVRTATVAGTGGNATFVADGPLDACSQINVAAQADTSGAWTFGWNDVACPCPSGELLPFRQIIGNTSPGNVRIVCGSGHEDVTPATVLDTNPSLEVRAIKFSSTDTTITGLSLMF